MSCKEAGPQMEGKKRSPEDDLEGLFKEFRWPTVSAKRRTSSPDGDNKTVPTMSSKEVGQKMEEKKRPPEQELEGLFKEFRWPTVPAKRRTASRDPDNSIVPILPIAKAVCQNRCFSESTSKVLEETQDYVESSNNPLERKQHCRCCICRATRGVSHEGAQTGTESFEGCWVQGICKHTAKAMTVF